MTDAQRALEEWPASTSPSGLRLGPDEHAIRTWYVGNMGAIFRALRLLAAVEAGTHKVVPIKATAENGMKYNLIGEFRYERTCYDDDGGELDIKIELTWPETKEIYDKMLQAAPDFFAGEKEG